MKSTFSKLKTSLLFLFISIYAFAQDGFYDDLPPEFGLDDDPEPGAPIDFLIPIVIGIMLISLFIYFYKNRPVNE
uniref:hypothetical protein n=1 Tax=Flavobacterium sp. TaxID=239 RepID=UPI00404A9356